MNVSSKCWPQGADVMNMSSKCWLQDAALMNGPSKCWPQVEALMKVTSLLASRCNSNECLVSVGIKVQH